MKETKHGLLLIETDIFNYFTYYIGWRVLKLHIADVNVCIHLEWEDHVDTGRRFLDNGIRWSTALPCLFHS